MYSRIMVPLDGSALAAQALPYGKLIAEATSATLLLFRATPSHAEALDKRLLTDRGREYVAGYEHPLERKQWERLREGLRHQAQEELEAEAAVLRAEGFTVETIAREGKPAESITDEARTADGTLIVMTTHGRSGLRRWWSGSVTEKVVRSAAAPTFVVRSNQDSRAPEEPIIRHIILPLDGSDIAEQAIPHAVALATALRAGVEVVRATTAPVYIPVRYPLPEAVRNPMDAGIHAETEADRYLSSVTERLQDMGTGTVRAVIVRGDAGSVITDAAEKTADSVVIMTTHGRSGIGRWVVGSVADKVMRHSSRPVFLVRAREEAARQAA